MPRISIQQTNFTAGEISPRLMGRTDIDRYGNSAKQMVNAYPVIHGGAKRRDGTRFVAATKFAAKKSRLIPFVFSRDDAYMLEFGDLYMRAFKNGAALAVEVVTPYTEAMLPDIDFVQGADTMFLAHPNVPIQRLRRFSDTSWDLSAAPFTTTPFDEQGHILAANITLSATSVGTARTVTADAGVFLASDVGRVLLSGAGQATVTSVASATSATVDVTIAFAGTSIASGAWRLDASPQTSVTPSAATPVGAGITLTAAAAAWRAEDVGKFVRINNGLCKITALSSTTVVSATIITALNSTVASPALAWSLESTVWSAANGYPRTLTLHEQRLVVASTAKYPQTIWGSRTGEYLDFTKGTADDDSYSFTIATDEINPIGYVASLRNLIAHTYGGEFSLQGGVEKPITPTNVRIRPESSYGSKGVRPVLVGKESIFVQRAGRKLRALSYSYSVDGYAAPDLAVLAEHITEGGITSMAYQQEPDLLLWSVRGDGALLSCTIDREQAVIGWAKHFTDGAFEAVATIPAGDREQTWVIVSRTVNGATARYVERFDDTFTPTLASAPTGYPPINPLQVFGCTVDCAVSVDNPAGQSVFTGLGHLEGKQVSVLADGSVLTPQTVVGGQITIPRNAYRTLIGLPFTTRVTMLSPEVGTGTGTAQGNSMRTSEISIRFLNTLGASVFDGDGGLVGELSFRQLGAAVLDQVPALFTGIKRIEKLGWERGRDELTIVQNQPLPMHVLSVMRKFQIND